MFRRTAVGKAGGRWGEGIRGCKPNEGQGEAHNGRSRAESPSEVAADTLTVSLSRRRQFKWLAFWGGGWMDVLRVLFEFANTIYIIEHVDTLFIVREEGADRLRESKRTEEKSLVANKEAGRRTVVQS